MRLYEFQTIRLFRVIETSEKIFVGIDNWDQVSTEEKKQGRVCLQSETFDLRAARKVSHVSKKIRN